HPATKKQQIDDKSLKELIPPPSVVDPPFRAAMTALTMSYMLNGFLRSLSNNGFEPGITVIQGTFGDTWQLLGRLAGNSGVALNYRGCFVWLGAAAYPKAVEPPVTAGMVYDYTSNTCHEIGHCCFRTHAAGFRPGGGPPGAANAKRHDVQTNNESICVMSYQDCEGQFCAICLFSFRGWDEKTLYH
ncbi:MAG TPA: hypothetical protein VFG95_03770, partial [Nitrospiria bacterium]|nr:hypothetical protein [Nitrospiria bacterium]